MSLEKITGEIERWFNSSSANTTGCHLRFPWNRLSILLFLSSTCLLKEVSKIKNIEKKAVASVNEKKNIAYKRKLGKIEDKLP